MSELLYDLLGEQRTALTSVERAEVIHDICEREDAFYLFSEDELDFFQRLPLFKLNNGHSMSLVDLTLRYQGYAIEPENPNQDQSVLKIVDKLGVVLIGKEFLGDADVIKRLGVQLHGDETSLSQEKLYETLFTKFRSHVTGLNAVQSPEHVNGIIIEMVGAEMVLANNLNIQNTKFTAELVFEKYLEKVQENEIKQYDYAKVIDAALKHLQSE